MARMESPDRSTTVSAKVSGTRLEQLESYCDEHDIAKSEVIRRGIDAVVGQRTDDSAGRSAPTDDERLADAWRALRRLTNGGGEWVRQDRACAHLAQRISDYDKNTVYGGLLRPLSDRGYLRLAADAQGRSAAVFVYE